MTDFEKHLNQNRRHMYRAAKKLGVTHNEALDCIQEAAITLSKYETLSYVDEHRVKGLFCLATRQKAIETLEKRDQYDSKLKDIEWTQHRSNTNSLHRAVDVHRALSILPDVERYVVWKYLALENTLREISEDLKIEKNIDMSHTQVMHTLRRGKKKLKAELKRLGYS